MEEERFLRRVSEVLKVRWREERRSKVSKNGDLSLWQLRSDTNSRRNRLGTQTISIRLVLQRRISNDREEGKEKIEVTHFD